MPTSIQLDPEMEARLEKLSEVTGHSKLHNLFQLIEQGMEDAYLGC